MRLIEDRVVLPRLSSLMAESVGSIGVTSILWAEMGILLWLCLDVGFLLGKTKIVFFLAFAS